MPPKAEPQYQRLDVRLASFTSPHLSNKASLSASQSRRPAKARAWPHPLSASFNPNTLSKAGFYFDPSDEAPDNCTCFLCGKSLGGWEEGDDPALEHVKHDASECGWARAVCQVELEEKLDRNTFMFSSTERLPSAKTMERARYDTFSNWWPHDKVPKHSASSKKMARAGFCCTPTSEGEDTVTCTYCGASLSEWEPGDDPVAEHRRKSPNCVYFTAEDRVGVEISTQPEPAGPARKVNGTTKKLTKSSSSSQVPSSQPSKSLSSRSLRSVTDAEVEPAPSNARTARKTRAVSVSRRGTTRNGETSASEMEVESTAPTVKGKSKAKATKGALSQEQSQTTSVSDVVEDGEPAKKKRGRPKKVVSQETEPKAEPEPEPEPELQAEVQPLQPKKRGRPKKVESEPENPVIVPSEDDDAATAKPRGRSGKGKSKTTLSSQPSASESQEQTEPARTTRSTSKQALHSESEDVPEPAAPRRTRVTRAMSTQPEAPPDLRRSTRTRPQYGMSSQSETEPTPSESEAEPAPSFGRSTRSRTAQPETQPEELSLSDLNLSEQPSGVTRAKGKGKAKAAKAVDMPDPDSTIMPVVDEVRSKKPTSKARGRTKKTKSTKSRPQPSEDEDIEMLTAESDVESVRPDDPAEDNVPELVLPDTGGEESDVEEVERTILGPSQPEAEEARPVTPPSAAPALPGPSLPIPAMASVLPLPPISNFTEAELSMTLEEWVRHETRRQYEVLRAEGERRIAEFVEKARVVRARIETHGSMS